jgi:hypothetical protein
VSARPYRLTERVTPEDELHASVARMLRLLLLPPAQWSCFPAGNVPLPKQHAAKLARFGLARGWPDFLILYGTLFGIELKRRGGRLSKTKLVRTPGGALRELIGQEEMFPRLERAGMQIAVCHSPDEVLTWLHRWHLPVRIAELAA